MPRHRLLTGTATKKPVPVLVFSLLAVAMTAFVWLPKLAADTQAAPPGTAQAQQVTDRRSAIDARRQAAAELRQQRSTPGARQNQFTPDSGKGAAIRVQREKLHTERREQKQATIAMIKGIRAACTAQHKTDTKAIALCSRDRLIEKARQRAAERRQKLTQAKAQR